MLFKKFFKNLFSKILRIKKSEEIEVIYEDEREYESQYLDDEE